MENSNWIPLDPRWSLLQTASKSPKNVSSRAQMDLSLVWTAARTRCCPIWHRSPSSIPMTQLVWDAFSFQGTPASDKTAIKESYWFYQQGRKAEPPRASGTQPWPQQWEKFRLLCSSTAWCCSSLQSLSAHGSQLPPAPSAGSAHGNTMESQILSPQGVLQRALLALLPLPDVGKVWKMFGLMFLSLSKVFFRVMTGKEQEMDQKEHQGHPREKIPVVRLSTPSFGVIFLLSLALNQTLEHTSKKLHNDLT